MLSNDGVPSLSGMRTIDMQNEYREIIQAQEADHHLPMTTQVHKPANKEIELNLPSHINRHGERKKSGGG